MTAPMLTKAFRSESTCLRISVSAPPRVMKKLDILFLGGLLRRLHLRHGRLIDLLFLGDLFEVLFLMKKKIFLCGPEEGSVVNEK